MSSIVKSYSFTTGDIRGDMFYIQHNSNNFTVIDCFLKEGNDCNCRSQEIIDEIKKMSRNRIHRFISTHPDNDHILGIEELDQQWNISNFYAVDNKIPSDKNDKSLTKYLELLSNKNFAIERGITRKWLNDDDDTNGSSRLNFHWPVLSNEKFKKTLEQVRLGNSPNNISCALTYSVKNGATYMWMGDMETDMQDEFYNTCKNNLPQVDILFQPHHGRKSGALPKELLDALNPKLIIIGNAPSEYINYGDSERTITQNIAGDITFINESNKVHIFTQEIIRNPPKKLKQEVVPFSYFQIVNGIYCGTLIL